MKVGRGVELCVLAAVLLAVLGLAFLWQGQKKDAASNVEAVAGQDKKLAEQDKKLAEQNKKMAELDSRFSILDARFSMRKADVDQRFSILSSRRVSSIQHPVSNVGVVSIRKIFQDCKRNAKYRDQVIAEQGRIAAELDMLSREIEAQKDGLKVLRESSDDYLVLMKEVLEKQGKLQVQREIYERQRALKEQKLIEQLYKDILRETRQVAERKGLDVVFERSEPDFPSPSANDLTMTISTHKLLYGDGCVDITDEVMARVDEEGKNPASNKQGQNAK